jgi:hypothetical protein
MFITLIGTIIGTAFGIIVIEAICYRSRKKDKERCIVEQQHEQ